MTLKRLARLDRIFVSGPIGFTSRPPSLRIPLAVDRLPFSYLRLLWVTSLKWNITITWIHHLIEILFLNSNFENSKIGTKFVLNKQSLKGFKPISNEVVQNYKPHWTDIQSMAVKWISLWRAQITHFQAYSALASLYSLKMLEYCNPSSYARYLVTNLVIGYGTAPGLSKTSSYPGNLIVCPIHSGGLKVYFAGALP